MLCNKGRQTMDKADIGLIGLAVMGENLALNLESCGYRVAVYNRSADKVTRFVQGRANGKNFLGATKIEELVFSLKTPRKIIMMVKAGNVVDELIGSLVPHLEQGDILMDGGNSHYNDTERRWKALSEKGIRYIGTGISGGELGALTGPSIMPGGDPAAWPEVQPLLQSIAARAGKDEACCEWIGQGGAGHFVKMVHNGIEYGDMQLITEAYQIMHEGLGMTYPEMQQVFAEWNDGELGSYLIEITRDIMGYLDEDGTPLVEKILDVSGQKGTGKWTGITALDLGVPLTLIGEAVFARCLSSVKDERVAASQILTGPDKRITNPGENFISALRDAVYAAKIISYAQGYALMREAAADHGWDLNYGGIAAIWRGGCIIRSVFLDRIKGAYETTPGLTNLMLAPFFRETLARAQAGWREVVAQAARVGIPVPAISSALAYYDGYRCANLPANLLQAQRDYFGAHTYERVDKPRGEYFHTNWTGKGGTTASTTYQR